MSEKTQLRTYLEYLRDLEIIIESATDVLYLDTADDNRTDAWDNHPADAIRTAAQEEVERVKGEVATMIVSVDARLEWDNTRREYILVPI